MADKKEYEIDIRKALSSTGTLIVKSTNVIHEKAAPEKRVDRRKTFKDKVRERRKLKRQRKQEKSQQQDTREPNPEKPAQKQQITDLTSLWHSIS